MNVSHDTARTRFGLPGRDLLRHIALQRAMLAVGMLALTAGGAKAQSHMSMSEHAYGMVLFDLFEAAPGLEGRPVLWDMSGSFGTQYNRFWLKSDGGLSTGETAGEMDFQVLYSRLIAPFWEVQAGVRLDVGYAGGETRTRGHLVLGLEGLAPYWFELEPAVFVSQDGDVSASLTGSYELYVTQRWLLQPRMDVAVAAQEVEAWGTGSGLSGVGFGLRLRYEIRREFAPYVGFQWDRLAGGTAKLARRGGEQAGRLSLVVGVRAWR